MDETCRHYLNDTIGQLIEMAKETENNDEFNQGILFGYFHSISFLLNQANAFQILDLLDKEIQDFIPESLIRPIPK
jgi:hypothetical protein